MIPKEAFWSIAAVMGVSCAFGYVMRGIIDRARESRKTAKERRWMDDFTADHDRWEDDPDPAEMYCSNCAYEQRDWWQEPCDNCNGYNKWKGAKG